MRRTLRIGAGFLLALLIVTCTDKDVTGPRARGVAALNLSAFQSAPSPGQPDIPLDSLRITLDRISDGTTALDTVLHTQADTLPGDSLVLRLSVQLKTSPESFVLTVLAYGGGAVWYQATDTTSISSGATASPRLLAKYVGPGAGATAVAIGPVDTTVVGGQVVALRAVVDSSGVVIASVPVGFSVSDTSRGKVTQPTFLTGTFTGALNKRDSVWLYVETPTHLRDSTRIHIVPPASQLVKISGDSQTVLVNAALAQPLTVRVEDALSGGVPGTTVTWSAQSGSAAIVPTTTISDTGGNAHVTVTPSSLGTVKVQATAGSLGGSPITFTINVLAGNVRQVIVSPKLDTIAKGATAQFTAVLKDSLGNVINGIKPVWTSSNTQVATVDSTGLATSLAHDSTHIIASAGGFADTARLYVRAPAKVAITPSDTVITAIGDSVHLTGVVLTNFGDTVKTATGIRFATTTPTVATVNPVTGMAHIVGAGTGVILAVDTIGQDSGTATLRVSQKVNGIVNTPPDSILVGINGQAQIIGTAVDRNGHPIPGKTFGWISRNTTVATVSQTGVVTGHAVGAFTFAVDSIIDSLSVFKDSTRVVGTAAPPPVFQWAFDTLAIGNGGNTTVTVSLNTPSVAGTVMQIVSSDTTKVKPTATRIVIGTGGATASVTLQGLGATVAPVNVVAQDSAGIYAPDTLRVIVVSTIYFALPGQTTRTQDYYLNQNETENAQIFLSDPAPLGGLGVSFVFGKPGTSAVAPTTVIIPQGQLAAPVQFVGVAAGTDSVIPSSGAFAGKFSYLHVAANNLTAVQPYPYTGTIGLGQYEQVGLQIAYGMDHLLPFTATVTPSGIATVPTPDTILINSGSRYFYVTGTTLGSGTLTLSATNWVASGIPVIVTTPKLQIGATGSIIAGAPPSAAYWYAYAEDSLSYQHLVSAPVHVTAVSRDTTVVKVLVDTTTIQTNNSSASTSSSLQAQPGAGGDSTYLVISAPGYRSDSIVIHVTPPALGTGYGYPYDGRVALNTQFANALDVTIQYARPDSFWVLVSHTRKGIVAGADSILIPKGQTTGYMNITGDTLGVDSVTITRATGYTLSAAPQFVLHVDSLHVRPYSYPTTLYTISTPQAANAEAIDAVNLYPRPLVAPLQVTMALSRPGVVTLDSVAVTIPAGQYFTSYDTMRVAVGVAAPDSTKILITAPGSTPDSTNLIHVQPTPLQFGLAFAGNLVGRGLQTQNNYVYLPAAAPNTLSVAISHLIPGKDSLIPTVVTILKGSSSSSYFNILGLDSTGTDTLAAAATGFVTAKAAITLYRDTLTISKPSVNQITTAPPYRLYTYLYNKAGYNQKPWAPVTLTFTSSNPNVVSIDSGLAVNATLDTVTTLADTNRAYAVVRINFVGPGNAYLKVTAPGFGADSMGPFSVTGPSLSLSSPSTTVGVGQFFTEQVSVQNPVSSPLTVTLQRSDSTLPPASQAFAFTPVTLTIQTGQYSSNIDTVAGNSIGTAQLIARAPGYGSASATVQVGQPRLSAPTSFNMYVDAVPSLVTAYTQDQSNNYRLVTAATPVSVTITDPSVLAVDSVQRIVPAHGDNTPAFKFTALQKGVVQVYFSSPGYKPDTMLVTADTGTLTVSLASVLGANEIYSGNVSIPYVTPTPLVVTLTSSNPGVLRVPPTVTILANNSSVAFTDTGVAPGAATITASAPGVAHPSTAVGVTVTTPRLILQISTAASAGQALNFNMYAQDSAGNYHNVASNQTITLVSSLPGHTVFTPPTPTILAGNQGVGALVTFDTAGTYSVSATAAGFTSVPSLVTVTGALIRVGVGNATTFTPGTDTVAVNHYATWVWDATNTTNHQIHWLTGPGSLPGDSPTQASGSYQVYFTTPGTYTYWCTIHTVAMQGTIVVQ